MSTPTPGATGSANAPDATNIINQFLASAPQASGSKPTTAWEDYGPLSRPQSDYEHGTYRQDPTTTTLHQYGTKSVTDMTNEYYGWNQQQKDAFRSKLSLIDKSALTAPDDTIASAWNNYVQQSANYYSAGQHVSPFDIMAKDIATKSGPGAAPTTKTQTTSDTTLTSRIDATAIFKSAAQSLLGRDPTDDEVSKFATLLNQQESANPTNATITTSTDAEGNTTSSNRTTTGGVSSAGAQDIAKQVAEQSPDYGANAANSYMNVLLGLVGVK